MKDTLNKVAEIAVPTALIQGVSAVETINGSNVEVVVKLLIQLVIGIAGVWKIFKKDKKTPKTTE